MKVLVCGSRGWTDREAIRATLKTLPNGTLIIHGAARGADMQADYIAQELGLLVKRFKPDWERFGKRAGIERNLQMLNEKPDKVIAFWDGTSPGTRHTITEARNRGIPVEICNCNL